MKKGSIKGIVISSLFSVVSLAWVLPVFIVFYNSFKSNDAIRTNLFSLPDKLSFIGIENYVKGIVSGNDPFYYAILFSVIITVLSVALILLCTSMAAWYIERVNTIFCKIFYYTKKRFARL